MNTIARLALMVLCISSIKMDAQTEYPKMRLEAGIQLYPAGIIYTASGDFFINSKSSIFMRAGINVTDRKDFSPYHDHEEGRGHGFSIGYRRHFLWKKGEIVAGLHSDFWNMKIDWYDRQGMTDAKSGNTSIFVAQPWLELGYMHHISSCHFLWHAGLAFGREINVMTRGEKVAQGWMGSALAGIAYEFGR